MNPNKYAIGDWVFFLDLGEPVLGRVLKIWWHAPEGGIYYDVGTAMGTVLDMNIYEELLLPESELGKCF